MIMALLRLRLIIRLSNEHSQSEGNEYAQLEADSEAAIQAACPGATRAGPRSEGPANQQTAHCETLRNLRNKKYICKFLRN